MIYVIHVNCEWLKVKVRVRVGACVKIILLIEGLVVPLCQSSQSSLLELLAVVEVKYILHTLALSGYGQWPIVPVSQAT